MVTIVNLIEQGLLAPGDQIVWYQRNTGVTHFATLATNGTIVTEDGSIHKTPSGAAKHLIQRPVDGWNVWKLKKNLTSLASLRDSFTKLSAEI